MPAWGAARGTGGEWTGSFHQDVPNEPQQLKDTRSTQTAARGRRTECLSNLRRGNSVSTNARHRANSGADHVKYNRRCLEASGTPAHSRRLARAGAPRPRLGAGAGTPAGLCASQTGDPAQAEQTATPASCPSFPPSSEAHSSRKPSQTTRPRVPSFFCLLSPVVTSWQGRKPGMWGPHCL